MDAEEATDGLAGAPARGGLVLASLIVVAAVANLNLSVANVALPSIGQHFDSGQTALDLIAVGYSLGLACSVLWLGALGDRYGRKLMLLAGTTLAVPMPRCSPRMRPPTSSSSSPGSAAGSQPGWRTRRRSR
jgi:MFS family permease